MTEQTEAARRIAADLGALEVRRGGTILVHSSLRALAPKRDLPGGAETVVRGLLEALGPEGTLLMPALTYASVSPTQPVFDLERTPCCVGAIPEHFRTRPGTRRSLHPTHSVCGVGPKVEYLLGEHHLDQTPCGPRSPFQRLREVKGQIVMLGCGLGPNTSMHAMEEFFGVPYLFRRDMTEYQVILAGNRRMTVLNRSHDPNDGYDSHYYRLKDVLGPAEMKVGRVLEAETYVLECQGMWRRVLEVLRNDPLHFVEPSRGR